MGKCKMWSAHLQSVKVLLIIGHSLWFMNFKHLKMNAYLHQTTRYIKTPEKC